MSSKRLDSIADYTRHGYALRVDCRRCRRVAVLDPLQIVLHCQQRGWSKQMAALEGHDAEARTHGLVPRSTPKPLPLEIQSDQD